VLTRTCQPEAVPGDFDRLARIPRGQNRRAHRLAGRALRDAFARGGRQGRQRLTFDTTPGGGLMPDSRSEVIHEARARLIELRASTLPGALHAIAEALPEQACEQAHELAAVLEAGWPELARELEGVIGLLGGEADRELVERRFARGWQATVLLREELRSGRHDEGAWQQDPERWLRERLAEATS
jgi:hypothetical protein